jgi:hypothetical protein
VLLVCQLRLKGRHCCCMLLPHSRQLCCCCIACLLQGRLHPNSNSSKVQVLNMVLVVMC